MICNKCGAPIPRGKTVCPYCGWQGTASQENAAHEEETVFADSGNYPVPGFEQDETMYAGDETVYANHAVSNQKCVFETPASPEVSSDKKKSKRKNHPLPRTHKKKGTVKISPLRVVLLVVLAILILLLIFR